MQGGIMPQTLAGVRAPSALKTTRYWHENQAVITLHSDISLSSDPQSSDIGKIIESLHLDVLNHFLVARGLRLKSFTRQDVLRPRKPEEGDGREDDDDADD